MTTQLGRYRIKDGELDTWARHWRTNIAPLRVEAGFNLIFAFVDRANNEFIYAFRFAGTPEELVEANRAYHATDEFVRRNGDLPQRLIESHSISVVEAIW